MAELLTSDRLREVLDYNPETGAFVWAKRTQSGSPIRAGDAAGHKTKGINEGYVVIGIDKKVYKAHRLAWLYMTGTWPPEQIDHINGQRDDNRWRNIRLASHSENKANGRKSSNSKTKFKGVYEAVRCRNKWVAQIRQGRVLHYLGIFDCPAAAHFAYIISADKLFGEFARAR